MATGVHDAPRLGLSQWVDSQVNDLGPGTALDSTGPVSYALRDAMQSEDRTSVLIANTFWQSYVNSVAFRRDLVKYGIDPRIVRRQEIMVPECLRIAGGRGVPPEGTSCPLRIPPRPGA